MSDIDERSDGGRFGAATPGARPERVSLEGMLSQQQPPGRRRPTWRQVFVLLAVMGVGAGYAAGHYITAAGSPQLISVVVTKVALPAGSRLNGTDLRVVSVQASAAPPGTLDPAQAAASIGLVTRHSIPAGTFLRNSLLAPYGAIPRAGQALVGLALKPGQVPADGLAAGQRVIVVLLPVTAQGTPLNPIRLITTTVWDTGAPDTTGTVSATVVVPVYLATLLAGYASRGEVALVPTSAATSSGGASPAANPTSTPTHSSPNPTKSKKGPGPRPSSSHT